MGGQERRLLGRGQGDGGPEAGAFGLGGLRVQCGEIGVFRRQRFRQAVPEPVADVLRRQIGTQLGIALFPQQGKTRPVAIGAHKVDVIARRPIARAQGLPADQGFGHRPGPAGGIAGRHPVTRIRGRQGKRHCARILGPRRGKGCKHQQPGGHHVAQKSHHCPVSPSHASDAIHNLGKFRLPR